MKDLDHQDPLLVCPLCWAQFDTEEELAQHEQEEEAKTYKVGGC